MANTTNVCGSKQPHSGLPCTLSATHDLPHQNYRTFWASDADVVRAIRLVLNVGEEVSLVNEVRKLVEYAYGSPTEREASTDG